MELSSLQVASQQLAARFRVLKMLAKVWKAQSKIVPGFLGGGRACGAFTAAFTPLAFAGGGGAGGAFLQIRNPRTWSLSASLFNLSIGFGDQ